MGGGGGGGGGGLYPRYLGSHANSAAARPSARATIGYLVYKKGGGGGLKMATFADVFYVHVLGVAPNLISFLHFFPR